MTQVDRDRWQQLKSILDEVLDLSADERGARLDAVFVRNPDLRADIEMLLRADARIGGVLDDDSASVVADALRSTRRRTPDGWLLPGTRVAGRYRIVRLLGRGGMGEVYRADDLTLRQAVALKFLPGHAQRDSHRLARLVDEARLARQVSHPNVCRVYDIGEWEDQRFLSMEFIDGEDLASLIRRVGPLPRHEALGIAGQLCAGIEAAHQRGILHRDLKPSNVMLDGRGQVRITDFGLAVATEDERGGDMRAGTPAYMAPEQLEGGEATARSDIYAIGLILYELFTGRSAFPASTNEELRRLREDSSPTNPSAVIDGFDPAVERAILQCLERDPGLRPASARDVGALLPAGDPLGAALAAGETPSPELVAASGPDGSLSPAVAAVVLGATLALLVASLSLVDRASLLGWLASSRTADVLEDNARAILARLGYDELRIDSSHTIVTNLAWSQYVVTHDTSPDRWTPLRGPGHLAMLYEYRQAPHPLPPLGRSGWVTSIDPPPAPGDVRMQTNLRGDLVALEIASAEAEPSARSAAPPDWSRLFREAGLDLSGFQPVTPTRNPLVSADVRAAWTGTLREFGQYPVRAEAASHRGKPVYFELVVPWDPYWNPSAVAATRRPSRPEMAIGLVVLFAVIICAWLAARNWWSGRGDRRGAFRIAVAVFALRFAVWLLGGHHVASYSDEITLFSVAIGRSLTDAFATWCFYLALEPHGRRVHPRLLVSWTRLLRGRVMDPLVGRDILFGVALGAVFILFAAQLYVVIPQALHLPSPPPPRPHPLGLPPFVFLLDTPPARTLLGGRQVLAAVPALGLQAVVTMLIWLMALLGLRLLLRRGWAALVVLVLTTTAVMWPAGFSEFSPIGVTCSFVATITMVCALRFGLVGLLTLWVSVYLWMSFPVTARVDAPYFGAGLFGVLIITGLGVSGALVASRRRPLGRIRGVSPIA